MYRALPDVAILLGLLHMARMLLADTCSEAIRPQLLELILPSKILPGVLESMFLFSNPLPCIYIGFLCDKRQIHASFLPLTPQFCG